MAYSPLNYQRIADKITQFGNNQHKLQVKQRIDVYKDRWDDLLLEELRRQFSSETWDNLKLLYSKEFNIIKRVINETSMVYKNPAERIALVGETEDENYKEMIEASNIDAVMPIVNRMTNLTNNLLVRPVVRKGKMEYDVLTLDNAEIILDPGDWKNIIGVKYYTGLNIPESYTYDDPAAATKKPWEFGETVGIDKAPIGEYDKAIVIMLEDKDDKGNYKSVMSYEFICQGGREVASSEPEELGYRDKDGNAVLPFVMFWKEYPVTELIDYTTGSDLYDANMTFAVNLTHLRYLQKFQSYKVMTLRTKDRSKLPANLAVDPGRVLIEVDSEGTGNTGLEVVDYQADLKEYWDVMKDGLTTFLTQYNISPANFTMSAAPQSGFSARINDKGKLEAREAQLPIYADREEELFNVSRVVWNTDVSSKKINDKSEFIVNFGEIDYQLSPDEEMKQDAFDLSNNVSTPIDIIQRNDPDLTEEQAIQRYNENKAFNSSQRGALIPPQQPGQPQEEQQQEEPEEEETEE